MAQRNLDPNPACANNATGRTSFNGSAPTRVTNLGAGWPRTTGATSTASAVNHIHYGARYAPGVDMGGRTFTAVVTWAVGTVPANDEVRVLVACFNSSGAYTGNATGGAGGIVVVNGNTANAARTTVVTGTVPAGTFEVGGGVYVPQSASGHVVTVGAIRLDETADPNLVYGDGGDAGWLWDGTAGSSSSTLHTDSAAWMLLLPTLACGPVTPLFRDDVSTVPDGPLAGRVSPSGHPWIVYKDNNPSGGEVPVIRSGAIGPPAGHVPGQGGTGTAAGYATVDLGGTCRAVGATIRWDTSTSTASAATLGAFTVGSVQVAATGGASMHLGLTSTEARFSVFQNGTQNYTNLTPAGYGSHVVTLAVPMARDGVTQHRVDIFLDQPAGVAYVNIAGHPTLVYSHPWIRDVAANFPFWEYYTVTGGTNIGRFVKVWAERV